MSFFDSVPEQPPPLPEESGRAAWMRPDAVIPGSTAVDLPLVRTDEVAVAVSSVRAYPNGFEFTVHVRLRQDQLVWGAAPLDWVADLRTRQSPERALRLGVLYADGRRAATPSHHPQVSGEADDSESLVLLQVGSGGSERQWDGDYWVHPLPPDGPVTLVASWLLYEVAETRAELDGAAIRGAAGRAVTLWPDTPGYKPRAG